MSRPSAWGRVWSTFWASIFKTPPKQKKYVGVDSFGNRYYEFEGRGHGSNVKRGYDAGKNLQFLPPVEWQGWLNGSRRFPPSDQEIELNRTKQQAQLTQDLQTERRAPNVASEGRGAGDIDRPKQFPTYGDDIEITPGAEKQKH